MRKKFVVVSFALLVAVLLSGCTGSTAWPGLSASGDVAYLANITEVYGVDSNTGALVWRFSGEGGGFLNTNPSQFVVMPVTTEDGLVIVFDSGQRHVVYALDTNDLNEDKAPAVEWTFSDVDGLWIAPPLVLGNRLFAPNSDGNVYVLDLNDGKAEKIAIEVIEIAKPGEGEARLWAQPVSDGGRLYVTSLDHSVIAIDLETYDVLWHEDLDGAIPAGIAIGSDGMLYVGSLSKQLEKFDPITGKHEPVLDTNGWIWSTPIVDGDNLYFGDVDGYFYSYNVQKAALNFEPVKLDGVITASPLVAGENVLVATESGDVFAIDGEGKSVLWFDVAEGKAYTTPVFANDRVLVAYLESDYYLIALDEEGHQAWTFAGE